jgi:CheY-like chemotaxis protein
MPRARTILVVEDFEPFRTFVRRTLEQRSEYQIVQASDGLEAVDKAQELQPDLILMDIGLPKLNGLEATRRIRTIAPGAKILLLSQESDPDVLQESFRTGARAYIHKPFALSHLMPAIDVVLWGRRFVSGHLEFKDPDPEPRHDVQFYCDDSGFLPGAARFIKHSLRTADATVVLATKFHRDSLFERLAAEDSGIEQAALKGTYIALDAADTLSTITVNGMPDPVLFSASLRGLIESISKRNRIEHPRVAIFGECVGLLCAGHNTDAAIRLEQVGNDLSQKYNLDILCAYPLPENGALKPICAEHTAVYWP